LQKTVTRAVLFDLDGTLVDTAPDLAHAANEVRAELSLPPLPLAHYRPVASAGARGLLKAGLDMDPHHPDFPGHRDRFLQHYRDHLSRASRLFPGMDGVLQALEERGIAWGVVTNKPAWLAEPLLDDLDLRRRMACLVGARDGLASKPAPDLLLRACTEMDCPPVNCLYVGDDRRDVEAARAAGMPVLAVSWGYVSDADPPQNWQADAVLESPADLLRYCR
jgi:N-acetyl-D-muramate 6-phosphate phosphatase